MSAVAEHSINTVYLRLLQGNIILAEKCRYIRPISREMMEIGLYVFSMIRGYG
jgi:hypothetical protein